MKLIVPVSPDKHIRTEDIKSIDLVSSVYETSVMNEQGNMEIQTEEYLDYIEIEYNE